MRQYRSLVWLFWRQLVRRTSLWIVVALAGVVLLINFAVASRIVDNWGLLFPKVATLIAWPKAILPTPVRPPWPAWTWETLHALAASAFWVVIGFWTYRRHDFGSRIPTK